MGIPGVGLYSISDEKPREQQPLRAAAAACTRTRACVRKSGAAPRWMEMRGKRRDMKAASRVYAEVMGRTVVCGESG